MKNQPLFTIPEIPPSQYFIPPIKELAKKNPLTREKQDGQDRENKSKKPALPEAEKKLPPNPPGIGGKIDIIAE